MDKSDLGGKHALGGREESHARYESKTVICHLTSETHYVSCESYSVQGIRDLWQFSSVKEQTNPICSHSNSNNVTFVSRSLVRI